MEQKKDDSFVLTAPVGGLLSISKLRIKGLVVKNLVEAAVFCGLAVWLISISPLTLYMKLILFCVFCVPLGAFAINGIDGEDIVMHAIHVVLQKKNGKLYYYGPPKPKASRKKKTNKRPVKEKKKAKDPERSALWQLADLLEENASQKSR